MNRSPPAPDGGFWGWLAVFGCFMGNVIGDGVMYSFGIFIPYLKDYFKAGSGVTSTIYSLQVGVTFGSGPIASYMTNSLGWRLTTIIGSVLASAGLGLSALAPNIPFLFLSAGILLGLGLGIIYLPRLDCITQYFDKKRPFVTGLAICGSGLGTFIFAPITQKLLDTLGWKSAMLAVSGICLSNGLFAFCFKPLEQVQVETNPEVYDKLNDDKKVKEEEEEEEEKKEKNQERKETVRVMKELLKDVIFMMFAVSNFFTSLGYPIPYTFIPDNSKVLNMTAEEGSFIISTIGISNTIARLVLGILSQKMNRLFLYNSCLVVCGLSMCLSNYFQPMAASLTGADCSLVPVSNSTTPCVDPDCVEVVVSWACSAYIGQMIYGIVYGITSAAYVLLTTLVLADLLGPELFTNSFGLLLLFQGVATLIGPPIVGFMFDAYGNYDMGFVLMGLMIAISGLMLYPVPCVQRHIQKRLEKQLSPPEEAAMHI